MTRSKYDPIETWHPYYGDKYEYNFSEHKIWKQCQYQKKKHMSGYNPTLGSISVSTNGDGWYSQLTGSGTNVITVPTIQTYQAYYNVVNGWACGSQSIYVHNYPSPETDEARLERERREVVAAQAAKLAEERAERTLFLFLTPAQREQYLKEGHFETLVNDRCYRIRKGRAMNVDLMENGQAKYKYCVLPEDSPPPADVMLAQLLLLQTDEARFLATANRTVLHHSNEPTDPAPASILCTPDCISTVITAFPQ